MLHPELETTVLAFGRMPPAMRLQLKPDPIPTLLAVVLALFCSAARPADDIAAACTIVFGQARSTSVADEDRWDKVNAAFNAQAAATLAATGTRVIPVLAPADPRDPGAIVNQLLRTATDHGCATIVETTIFADYEAKTLIARLRVFPVVPEVDGSTGSTGSTGFRIAPSVYVVQRDFDLSQATLDRVKPAVLGSEMATEYARHNDR
jgi:hypothetical protein